MLRYVLYHRPSSCSKRRMPMVWPGDTRRKMKTLSSPRSEFKASAALPVVINTWQHIEYSAYHTIISYVRAVVQRISPRVTIRIWVLDVFISSLTRVSSLASLYLFLFSISHDMTCRLPMPILPADEYETVIMPNAINYNHKIRTIYEEKILKMLCPEGDDGQVRVVTHLFLTHLFSLQY